MNLPNEIDFNPQAGASRVLAVEASNVAKLSRQIIDDNGFHDKIEVSNYIFVLFIKKLSYLFYKILCSRFLKQK